MYDCFNENSLINNCIPKGNYTNEEIQSYIIANIIPTFPQSNFKSPVYGNGNKKFQVINSIDETNFLKNGIPSDYNLSIIDLGERETKLKQEYHISPEDPLIILKEETTSDKSSEKDVEYEVF